MNPICVWKFCRWTLYVCEIQVLHRFLKISFESFFLAKSLDAACKQSRSPQAQKSCLQGTILLSNVLYVVYSVYCMPKICSGANLYDLLAEIWHTAAVASAGMISPLIHGNFDGPVSLMHILQLTAHEAGGNINLGGERINRVLRSALLSKVMALFDFARATYFAETSSHFLRLLYFWSINKLIS